jgi:hypothetical protein
MLPRRLLCDHHPGVVGAAFSHRDARAAAAVHTGSRWSSQARGPAWNIRLAGVSAASPAADSQRMVKTPPTTPRADGAGEVEFFGVKLKVNSPRLAALLNSDVTDEVSVVVSRARGTIALSDADIAADVRSEADDARLDQTIASAVPVDVRLRSAGELPADDEGPLAALVEHPA